MALLQSSKIVPASVTAGFLLAASTGVAAQGVIPPVPPVVVPGAAVTCGPLVTGYVTGKIVKALTPADTGPAARVVAGTATGALVGAAIGSVVPGIGTAAGAVIGGVCGAIGAWFS